MKMIIGESDHHVGSTERVHVAHVNDLNGLKTFKHDRWRLLFPTYLDFYLQREIDQPLLIKLDAALFHEYSKILTSVFSWKLSDEKSETNGHRRWFREPVGNYQPLEVNDYCACPSEDEVWYRGLIRQRDLERAWVYRIDYGDVRCIPLQYLRPLKVHRQLQWKASIVLLVFSGTILRTPATGFQLFVG